MPAAEIKNFWEQTKASLAEVDVNATVEPVEQTDVFTMDGRREILHTGHKVTGQRS